MTSGHHDVVQLVTEQGVVVASFEYDAFGVIVEEEGDGSNPYRYSGYFYDVETMLYYIRCRYYDAGLARFLQEDTYYGDSNDPLSLNLYAYCKNDPIKYFDPTGHMTQEEKLQFIDNQIGYAEKAGNKTLADGLRGLRAEIAGTSPAGTPNVREVNAPVSLYVNGELVHSTDFGYFTPENALYSEELGLVAVRGQGLYRIGAGETLYDLIDRLNESNALYDNIEKVIQEYEANGHAVSWWRDKNGRMIYSINTSDQYSSVQLVRQGDQVVITVYVDFSSDSFHNFDDNSTYADIIEEGMRMWGGTYEGDFGYYSKIDVSMNIIRRSSNMDQNQRYVTVEITDGYNWPEGKDPGGSAGAYGRNWSPSSNDGHMFFISGTNTDYIDGNGQLQNGDFWYSKEALISMTVHEFGHILSVREAYGENPDGTLRVPLTIVPINASQRELRETIINSNWEYDISPGFELRPTATDMNMVLYNWFTQTRWGYFNDPGGTFSISPILTK